MPTAPKETEVLLAISATITAAIAGKPRERSKGATNAAGVPKPAYASNKGTKKPGNDYSLYPFVGRYGQKASVDCCQCPAFSKCE